MWNFLKLAIFDARYIGMILKLVQVKTLGAVLKGEMVRNIHGRSNLNIYIGIFEVVIVKG